MRFVAPALFLLLSLSACHPTRKMKESNAVAEAWKPVVAHRGAWKHTGAPQNSLASLRAAIDMGCHASEFDVHMTADSVLVVNHDPTHAGMRVQHTGYAELSAVKLKNGEPLPLLRDFLSTGLKHPATRLVLEIKPSTRGREWANATVQKTVSMVREMKAEGLVTYICFDYDMLLELLRIDPAAKAQYLNGDRSAKELKADRMEGADYNHAVYTRRPGLIDSLKKESLVVNVWTVNDSTLMEAFLQAGVDMVTTDEPERLFRMIRGRRMAR
jgi:glycerophosphoryl diester phosphodiesterase